MSSSLPRFSLCVVVMACLAGCGGSPSSSSGGGGTGGGSPTTVTYTFTGALPTAVATQIGTGAYQLTSLQAGKLTVSVPSGTANYSVAWICPTDAALAFTQQFVFHRSIEDGASFSEHCPQSPAPQRSLATLEVNAAAIPGAESISIWGAGYSLPQLIANGTVSFSGQMVAGTYDVFVVAYGLDPFIPIAVRILRSQTIPGALNGGNPVVFTPSDATVSQTISNNNLPNGLSIFVSDIDYWTFGGQELALGSIITSTPATQYPAIPAAAVQNGDYYTFQSAAYSSLSGGGESVAVQTATASGGAQTITYPSPWVWSGPSAATLPTFSFNYPGFSGMSSIVQSAWIRWIQGKVSNNSIQVSATGNYQNGATSIAIPDLSGLAGFLAPSPSGTTVYWSASIQEGSAFETTPPSGIVQTVGSSGQYTEP